MNIGLIDLDSESRGKVTYPNIGLMKISMWHKSIGDNVEWAKFGTHYDKVYISRVFSDAYTSPAEPMIDADEVVRGGNGYAISVVDGVEVYDKSKDAPLPEYIEGMYPDYSIYGLTDDAHGFLTRGCPRGCKFCHVAGMQGRTAVTVHELKDFWDGQRNIHLYDPNILASKDWEKHFAQLIESNAYIDFNQGLDVRLLNKEKVDALNRMKYKMIHFAWDNPQEDLRDALAQAKQNLRKCSKQNTMVYILANFNSTLEQDIERVEFVKSLKMQPYLMVYRGDTASKELKRLKRYANNPYVCWGTPSFKEYDPNKHSERFRNSGITHKNRCLQKTK